MPETCTLFIRKFGSFCASRVWFGSALSLPKFVLECISIFPSLPQWVQIMYMKNANAASGSKERKVLALMSVCLWVGGSCKCKKIYRFFLEGNPNIFLSRVRPPTHDSITFLFDWKLSTPEKKGKAKEKLKKDGGKMGKLKNFFASSLLLMWNNYDVFCPSTIIEALFFHVSFLDFSFYSWKTSPSFSPTNHCWFSVFLVLLLAQGLFFLFFSLLLVCISHFVLLWA